MTYKPPFPNVTLWKEKVANLKAATRYEHDRDPTIHELLEASFSHVMTEDEIREQRESWVRAMKPTGDPRFD